MAGANIAAFKAGHAFGETAELFDHPFEVRPAVLEPGTYTNITGNTALAWGLIAARQLSGLPLFLGSYPITPASDILHELSKHKNFGVRTLQAEDEIAGIGAAIGAAYGGHLAVTTTSGPGMALKGESMGLAVSLELPLLVIDIQRGGPSTGLPTKTEAADLLMAMYGRHGESPLPIVAARSPADCFFAAIEAARIALKYRTPVILLSDGYLANGAEPWRLPDVDDAARHRRRPSPPRRTTPPKMAREVFWPYLRDPDTLARHVGPARHPGADAPHRWAREGGRLRQRQLRPRQPRAHGHSSGAKVAGIAGDKCPTWRSRATSTTPSCSCSAGARRGAPSTAPSTACAATGRKVARAPTSGTSTRSRATSARCSPATREVLVPEMNLGQLSRMVRAEYLVDARSVSKVRGMPFTAGELEHAILDLLGGPSND